MRNYIVLFFLQGEMSMNYNYTMGITLMGLLSTGVAVCHENTHDLPPQCTGLGQQGIAQLESHVRNLLDQKDRAFYEHDSRQAQGIYNRLMAIRLAGQCACLSHELNQEFNQALDDLKRDFEVQ